MATDAPDIFALLDVTRREDSFTSVLVHALKRSQRLREYLYALAWKAAPKLRHEDVFLRRGLGGAGIADLVMYARDVEGHRWALFVEAKVNSHEGLLQTQRYLDALHHAGSPDRAGGIFLTITGHAAADDRVGSLTHRALAEALASAARDFEGDAALSLAVAAYVRRATVPAPKAEHAMVMSALMTETDGLLPLLAGAEALGHALVARAECGGPSPLDFFALTIQGRGHANPGLVFYRDTWSGPALEGNTWTPGSFDAHVEVEIVDGDPGPLKVHFETAPYMPQSSVRELVNREGFFAARDTFRAQIHEHARKLPGWRMTKRPLQAAAWDGDFDEDATVGAVVEAYGAQLRAIVPVVDAAIAEVERVHGRGRARAT